MVARTRRVSYTPSAVTSPLDVGSAWNEGGVALVRVQLVDGKRDAERNATALSSVEPVAMSRPALTFDRLISAVVVRTLVVGILAACFVLNMIEILRAGWNADNWGILGDYSELFMPMLAALLLARRARQNPRRGWAWMSIGAISWAIGQAIWMVIQYGMHEDPTVSVATIGFVGWAVLTTIGLMKLGGRSSELASISNVIAESLVLAASLGFLLWELVLAPSVTDQSNFNVVMLAIVPLSSSFVISSALLMCLHERPPVIVVVGVAAFVLLTEDSFLTVWFADNAAVLTCAQLDSLVQLRH